MTSLCELYEMFLMWVSCGCANLMQMNVFEAYSRCKLLSWWFFMMMVECSTFYPTWFLFGIFC